MPHEIPPPSEYVNAEGEYGVDDVRKDYGIILPPTPAPEHNCCMDSKVLNIKPGDVVVLRSKGEIPDDALLTFARAVSAEANVVVLSLPQDMSLDTLDEQDMRAAGWVREERVDE